MEHALQMLPAALYYWMDKTIKTHTHNSSMSASSDREDGAQKKMERKRNSLP